MKTRIISSVVFFPLLAMLIVIGKTPLKIGVLFLSIIATSEVYKVYFKKIVPINYISFIFLVFYYMFINYIVESFSMVFFFLFIIINLTYLVLKYSKITIVECAINIFVFFYAGILMSSIYLVRELAYGEYIVWLIFISAWGCDTFAYFTGKAIGKHKLIPTLSPNKTIEGFIGGILGSMVITAIYVIVVSNILNINDIYITILLILASGIAAIFSQVGDLTASAIKRYTNIKDYGKLIPGHGGIMDRFDSILFTAPIVYSVIILLVRF